MPLLIPSIEVHNGKIYCFCSQNKRARFSDKTVYVNNINIGRAVRASCSYPLVFEPCKYKNLELVDGGIRENIPWKSLKEFGATTIIGAAFEKETHCVDLTESTIEANKRFFESEDDVPRQAYTMGIKNIMQAKKILVVVSGEDKAAILKEVLYGPITPEVPASILQLHNDVTIVADAAALSKINM